MTRGADLLAKTLEDAGVTQLFSVSGNHLMALYDALLSTDVKIIHCRHEAACVHMADAWGRLTGKPGVAALAHSKGLRATPATSRIVPACSMSARDVTALHANTHRTLYRFDVRDKAEYSAGQLATLPASVTTPGAGWCRKSMWLRPCAVRASSRPTIRTSAPT